MLNSRESIPLGSGRTFRLLRWRRSVAEVEVVEGAERAVRLAGQGDHWHFHRATELTLMLRGTGTRFVADQIELFEPGDLVLIGSNVPHYWHLRGESRGFAVQWEFPLDHGIWSIAEAAPLRALEQEARHGLHLTGPTAVAIAGEIEALARTEGLSRFARFIAILGLLTAAPASDVRRLAPQPFSRSGTPEHQEAMARAVSYILAHYREPLHLGELLTLVNMSRATFARQFRHHAGKSFSTFVNQVRLQAVCRAMRETPEQIGSIALGHGFNNLSFFNRLFRRELGLSPSAYRAGRHVAQNVPRRPTAS